MNASRSKSTNQKASDPNTPRDVSFLVTESIFVFMAISELIDQEWFKGSGWILLAAGLVILARSAPMTQKDGKKLWDYSCLILFVAGIGLLLFAPGHPGKKPESSATNRPPAPADTTD